MIRKKCNMKFKVDVIAYANCSQLKEYKYVNK